MSLTQTQVNSARPRLRLTEQEAVKLFLRVLAERVPTLEALPPNLWDQLTSTLGLAASGPGGGDTGACVYSVGGNNVCAGPLTVTECDTLGGVFFPSESCPG